ncbi:MAG: GNAT family N-acetyltransferase [Clostridia bacterium]|nr:GNAT family N-acetyltransferase [Clostridia bacterium]
MTDLQKLISEITQLNIIKAAFSVPYKKDELVKCTLRPMGEKYQFESFTKTQAFHENVEKNGLCNKIISLLTDSFRQAEIFTEEYVYGIKISSKGKVLHNRRRNTDVKKEDSNHNREKNHIIDLDNAPPVLCDIGVIGKDGKIINSRYDKYKQICRFVEFIDDVVKKDPREEYNIIDFGCGKSYLTFICYHYMTEIANKKVNIVGLDLKKKVIEDCNALAIKYGYDSLKFLCMDIKDYNPEVRPDMVIALHACDVATDYALYNAYRWQADYIFSVPCCQHEMNGKVKSDDFSLLCDYGLLKERFSALATDALRGKYLEFCGYSVDVLEFIDIEHSPKNVLIRAKRTTKINDKKRKLIKDRIDSFTKEFNANLCFGSLVFQNCKEFEAGNEKYSLVVGKSSMLLKDALTVRNAVFGNEQNYKAGSSRDKDDDTAWFAGIYDKEGRAVATSRMIYLEEKNERLLGKIAVLADYRKFGFGSVMLSALENIAKEENATKLFVNAQKGALGFYEKLGYEKCGNSYTEEDIEMIPVSKEV